MSFRKKLKEKAVEARDTAAKVASKAASEGSKMTKETANIALGSAKDHVSKVHAEDLREVVVERGRDIIDSHQITGTLETAKEMGRDLVDAGTEKVTEISRKVTREVSIDLKLGLDWREKLQRVMVISKSGLLMYSQAFLEGKIIDGVEKTSKEILAGGALVGISSLVKEIAAKSSLKTLEQEEFCVLVEESDEFIVAAMATEELTAIRNRMKDFSLDFQEEYGSKVSKWSGDPKVFAPVKDLVVKHFE